MRSPAPCQATIRGVNDRTRLPSDAAPTPAPPSALPGQAPAQAAPVTHYENFPVASLLCPPHLRQPIAAIYAFARTADDIADEGDALPSQRLADLAAYRQDLMAIARDEPPSPRWAQGNAMVETQKSMGNVSKYTLKSNSTYKVVSRVGETFIYINAPGAKTDEINEVLKKLGY